MKSMSEAFEEDVIDALIKFTKTRKEMATISYMEFSEVEEVYPILSYFQDNVEKASKIFYAAGYPMHPTAVEDAKTQVTRIREEIEDILGYAIAPWSLRSSIRFRFARPQTDPGYTHVIATVYVEVRSKSEDDEVLHRSRVAIPMTLMMELDCEEAN